MGCPFASLASFRASASPANFLISLIQLRIASYPTNQAAFLTRSLSFKILQNADWTTQDLDLRSFVANQLPEKQNSVNIDGQWLDWGSNSCCPCCIPRSASNSCCPCCNNLKGMEPSCCIQLNAQKKEGWAPETPDEAPNDSVTTTLLSGWLQVSGCA